MKSFASRTLPTLEDHLKMAEQTQAALGGAREFRHIHERDRSERHWRGAAERHVGRAIVTGE